MKKTVLFFIIILAIGIVIYISQDKNKIEIMQNYDKTLKVSYGFCKDNKLCKVTMPGIVVSYTIDDAGNRIKKFLNGKLVERYYWIGDGKLKTVTDEKGKVLREYLYRGKFSVLPYAMKTNDEIYYLLYNKMRTLRVLTNKYNNIVKIRYYNKKGEMIKDTNSRIKVDFSYAGGIWDSDAKLLFFNDGVYNPLVSKWISKVKERDIIKNLKELNGIKKDDVYICKATLDTFYHSFICSKNRCGGLYAAEYLRYFDAKGYMLDNSVYFNKKYCEKLKLPKYVDKKRFAKCVFERIIPREGEYFDVFKHNCHDEVKDIIKTCTKKVSKETP
jgi:YD repeat-containing protein